MAPCRGITFCFRGQGSLPDKWWCLVQMCDVEGPLAAPGRAREGEATVGAQTHVADLVLWSRPQGTVLLQGVAVRGEGRSRRSRDQTSLMGHRGAICWGGSRS